MLYINVFFLSFIGKDYIYNYFLIEFIVVYIDVFVIVYYY